MQELLRLRPVEQSDLAELMRIYTDPTVPGELQWFGFRVAKAREVERRWTEDGLIKAARMRGHAFPVISREA
jgi:hypothetical protein